MDAGEGPVRYREPRIDNYAKNARVIVSKENSPW
jgi:hypothetical protein